MFKFQIRFIENYKRRRRVQALIQSELLMPIESFEQYNEKV